MIGKGDIYHNNRKFIAENVDKSRTAQNIIITSEEVKNVYHELFDKALAEYNSKQKRKDRMIKDYHEHIRHSRQEKEFHEVIFQIGNKDDTPCCSRIALKATEILKQYAESFQERNPHLKMFNAVIHLDEATPHIHIDFVPFATDQKRGLSTRVSLSKALEQQGFRSNGRLATCSKQWIDNEKQVLGSIMKTLDIEWEEKGTHNEHLSVLDYKKQERQKEIATLDKQISKAAKKVVKINAINNIHTKNSFLGDRVTIDREDYEKLADIAKKQIADEKKEKKLKSENSALQQIISEQSSVINHLNAKIRANKSINLLIENRKLKERISTLEKFKSYVTRFLDKYNLLGKFKNYFKEKELNDECKKERIDTSKRESLLE